MGRLLLIALRNIFAQKRRSLLLGTAIGFVTWLLVLLFAFSGGLQDNMIASATSLASGHVNVGGFYKVSPSVARPIVLDFAKVAEVVAQTPGVAFQTRRGRGGFDRLTSPKTSLLNAVSGIDVASDRQLRARIQILSGSLDALREPDTLLLFERQATELEVAVGDTVTLTGLTARGVRNRADVRVAAIARDMGGLSQIMSFVPESTLNAFYQLRPENTGVLMAFLDQREEAATVAGDLRERLRAGGWEVMEPEAQPFWQKQQVVEREDWTGQRLDVSTWRDEMGQIADVVEALDAFAVVFTLILMAVIAIGLWNTLFMAVRERTAEIGALRAIGMSRRAVRFQFVAEAGVLALLAASAGAALGGLTVAIVNAAEVKVTSPQLQFVLMSDTFILSLNAARVVGAVLLIAGLTSLAALWPAHRASRIQPGLAMSRAGR
jgi:putative ABC transport system permease protein